jgi:hypothetical protein
VLSTTTKHDVFALTSRMSGDEVLQAALAYASVGWPVFPCVPGQKVPATAHGFRDASIDPGRISRWWQRDPERNVAIATGVPGPDVLDIDNTASGAAASRPSAS